MRPISLLVTALAAILAIFANFDASIAAPVYDFTTLDVPDSLLTYGVGINNAGQVAGFSQAPYNPNYVTNGFLFDPTSGTYTNVSPAASQDPNAMGINNLGQVVGQYTASYNCYPRNCISSFLFDATSGSYTILNNPVAGLTAATGINDSGQIIGYSSYIRATLGYTANFTPFLRDPVTGAYKSFTVPAQGAYSVFFEGINNAGLIVGYYTTPTAFGLGNSFGGTDHSFIFNPTTGVYTFLDDPLASPGIDGGFFNSTTGGTDAYGINDLGQVVGTYYDTNAPNGLQAFIYDSASGTYTTFTNPATPDEYLFPTGINDSGQIVGSYLVGNSNYSRRGFIATPELATAVPEPSSLALMGVFAGCAWLKRRRLTTGLSKAGAVIAH